MAGLDILVVAAAITLAGLLILAAGALRGWQGWLEIKRAELIGRSGARIDPAAPATELSGLRERVRRLEAIAAGIER